MPNHPHMTNIKEKEKKCLEPLRQRRRQLKQSKPILMLTILFFLATGLYAHENSIPLIIDTDMGLDDVRAIALFLSSDKAEIKAIVVSDGAASPRAGYDNIHRIYRYLERPTVPIGIGPAYGAPPWREKSDTLGWAVWPGDISRHRARPKAKDVIAEALSTTPIPVVYVCMGPLTNLADALKSERFPSERIEKVLYYGSSPDAENPGWNTRRDLEAARSVFSSALPIWVLYPAPDQLVAFDAGLFNKIASLHTDTARLIVMTHRDKSVQALFGTGHSMVWDEILPLYVDHPSLITGEQTAHGNPAFRFTRWDKNEAAQRYIDLLSHGQKKWTGSDKHRSRAEIPGGPTGERP